MATVTWTEDRMSVVVELDDEEVRHCEFTGNLRSELLHDGDPSMAYTTYEDQRADNNIMGQKTELAFLRVLQSERIPFSAICFTLTYVVNNTGVTAPLQDFAISSGATIDIKADRYPIARFGAVVPNEKLREPHIARVTVWAECPQDSAVVTFHGWNNRAELEALLEEADAVRPDGLPMPKSCKRMTSDRWRTMDELVGAMRRDPPSGPPLTVGVIGYP